jgi:hypothetical protein
MQVLLLNETTIAKQSEVAVSQLTIKRVQDKGVMLAQFIQQAARINCSGTTHTAIPNLLVHNRLT